MRKIYCDKCGNELSEACDLYSVTGECCSDIKASFLPANFKMDLCYKCYSKIFDILAAMKEVNK